MNRTCRTGVDDPARPGSFKDCGKPVTQQVLVGHVVCHYCDEHAAAARRYVESQGQAKIAEIQSRDWK